MNYPKLGQVFINTGFEAAYRTKLYHSVVRVLKVDGDVITVRSLADTAFGVFAFGGPMGSPFTLEYKKDFATGRFRPWRKEDLDTFKKHRLVNRVLFGPRK